MRNQPQIETHYLNSFRGFPCFTRMSIEIQYGFMYKLSAAREHTAVAIDASAATIQPDTRGK